MARKEEERKNNEGTDHCGSVIGLRLSVQITQKYNGLKLRKFFMGTFSSNAALTTKLILTHSQLTTAPK